MPRILVVDDETAIRSLLAMAFARAGYEVRTAGRAREALALCAVEAFDALLSDVLMPEMNGHELVHWVMAYHLNYAQRDPVKPHLTRGIDLRVCVRLLSSIR